MSEPEELHRWMVTITYRTESGPLVKRFGVAEIADIDQLVESGPHFDTIAGIQIVRVNHCTSPTLTIEAAEQL